MSTKRLFTLIVGLTLAVLFAACSPLAAHKSASLNQLDVAQRVPVRVREPLSVVQAFYSAVQKRNMDAAMALLTYEVTFVEVEPVPCISSVIKGTQALENELAYSNVFAYSADGFRADGNKVTYSMTKWVDPRIFGPNYPQPVKSHLVAVVQNGEIISITETRDPEWVALRMGEAKGGWCW